MFFFLLQTEEKFNYGCAGFIVQSVVNQQIAIFLQWMFLIFECIFVRKFPFVLSVCFHDSTIDVSIHIALFA